MTNTVLNYSSNQTISNELLSRSDVQALVDTSLVTSGIPTFSNSVSYVTDNIVYYLGIFYIAPSNIASGGGTPLVNTTWKQIENWGSYTTTASAAGTLTLTKYSGAIQRISGTTTHTIVLPVTSTLPALGKQYIIINSSTGAVAVQSSGANAIVTLTANQYCTLTCILLSGTTAASWVYSVMSVTSGDALTSGTLAQFAATTSAQLAGVISDETGSGLLVFATSPTLVTPVLGVATATSINKVAITAPATSATLTIADGKTLTASNSITFAGTDGKTVTFSNSITFAGTDSTVMTFPSTSASIARIDAAQSFTGTQTWNNYTLLGETSGHLMAQTLSADGKFSIAFGEVGTLGETVVFGNLLYFKAADSRWWRFDSDAEATSGPVKLAMAVLAGNAGEDVQLMLVGKIRADSLFATFTVGVPIYGSGTIGAVTATAPTSGFVRVVGYADTADSIYFNPSNEYMENGVFNLGLTFGGGSTGITFSAQSLWFNCFKKMVYFGGIQTLTSKGSSTGAVNLTSLPYAQNASYYSGVVIGYNSKVSYSGTINSYVVIGQTNISLNQTSEAGTNSAITDTNYSNDTTIVINGNYLR